uniref:Uncharacterized protein n=1 Tax=Cacopsylla melanoneura TaxID=428564 RepID=A0A8D8M7C2_9HEMI
MFELFLNDNLEDDDDDVSSIDDEELVDIANKMNQLSARKRSQNESNGNSAIRETDAKEPTTSEGTCSFENDTIDAFFKPIDPAPRESVGTNQRLLSLRNAKKSLDLSKVGTTGSDEDRHVVIDSVLELSGAHKEMNTLSTTTKFSSDPNAVNTIISQVEMQALKLNKQPICVPMQDRSLSTLPESIKLPLLDLKNRNIMGNGNKATEMKPKRGNNCSTVITLPPLVHPLKKKVNSRIPKAKTLYTAKHYLGEVVKKTTGLGSVSAVGKLPPIVQAGPGLSMSSGDGLCHVKKPKPMFPCSRNVDIIKDGVDRGNDIKLPAMSNMAYLVRLVDTVALSGSFLFNTSCVHVFTGGHVKITLKIHG